MRLPGVAACNITMLLLMSLLLGTTVPVLAQHPVHVNGYTLDVKGKAPSVPPELEPDDEQDGSGPPRGTDTRITKWIVQFNGPVHEADKQQLAATGCRIGDYLPDFAFVVSMDGNARAKVEKLPFINGVIRFKPAYKIRAGSQG